MKPKILFLLTFIMLLTSAFATDPWGDPVVLPGSMTVMAQVFINGIPASSNDVLAAMVEIAGTPEIRGKATIQNINGVAGCLIQIFTETNGEIIHFKVWDESAQTIFNVSQTLNSEVNGSVGSYPDNMYQIFAGSNMIVDPWTAPSILTNSMTVLAQVGISGNPTESNDILAAFVNVNGQLELRGKQQISIVNGISGCLIQIFTETNGEQVQFKIWDYSEQEIISCTTTLLTEVQGMVGSWPNDLFPVFGGEIYTVENPILFPIGGIYQSPQFVAINCSTPDAQIYYTLNGTDPTPAANLYSTPLYFGLNSTTEVRARAYKNYWLPSDVSVQIYTITGTVSTPTFNPPGGVYNDSIDVVISCNLPGAVIHYTMDGSNPDENSPIFSVPIHLAQDTLIVIKAKAYKTDWNPSEIASATYDMQVPVSDDISLPLIPCIVGIYPNPFIDSTSIKINLKEYPLNYCVDIYNIKGEKVQQFKGCQRGEFEIKWDGKDFQGNKLSSGIYLISLHTKTYSDIQKIILK